ncbi:putative metalloprotease CJM1_0395 family protein [Campylobacter sp.]|uniref:putative metalloprotease CJM1_0395 family protein n=1 Tax=Campylobacter sp. TaxID=205 RepID=UPI0026DC87FF|nr:putative metalloprotease CJM1_0395 family protein [Campylobacter sp.]MDO4674045.1 putative metalloprotease CJM1_0395 family protein [Campylobacter sp.]
MRIDSNYNHYHSSFQKQHNENAKNSQEEPRQMINGVELNAKEVQALRELQNIDRNVKAHEAAHQAAGGGLTGAASFSYVKGPDNQMYAVAGEVPIRMQEGNTPEQTIANARQIIAAAMAPSDPSPQDYKVAANAAKMEFEARAEMMKMKAQEAKKQKDSQENADEETNSSASNHIIKAGTA